MSPGDAGRNGLEVVDDPRGGFVLALVVLLLFGIGVAGAAGYQIVFNEALLSVHAKETQTALSIARAGLRSYIGKQIGVHQDIVTYSINGGDAVVTARLVAPRSMILRRSTCSGPKGCTPIRPSPDPRRAEPSISMPSSGRSR